jgi:general secretion pathway protein D
VALFDQRPKQVFIEAKILELTLSDDFQMGVNWDAFYDTLNPRSSLGAKVTSPVFSAANPGMGTLTYKTIFGDSSAMNSMLAALKTVGDIKILSNPHVAVIDGEEASIKVIQDTPYAETSAEITGGDTNFVGEEIRFIEVGVILTVTPRIGSDDYVQMAIRPEVSSASYDYQAFRQIPVVKKQYSETTVMIKNGETIIIAGMIQNSDRKVHQGVPYLGRIPLLGALFRTTQDSTETHELVVFLTPRTITGDEPVQRMKDLKKRPKPLRASSAVGAAASTRSPDSPKPLKPVR